MEQWQAIDAAQPEDARRLLRSCCGSERWVEEMMRRRPFASRETALSAARDVWRALDETDWKEAFSHHPKIGDREALRRRFPESHHLSAREQAGVDGAHGDVLGALASGNQEYKARFGYIFIVCATGKSAAEMLALLRQRLTNDPADEIRVAAEEQARITALRLTAS
ncbi:MAG TPA: 2-oxo-4-hydroxy-4-carboxy-5-ureidoimidazoline decarboxylase [Vicinamibacterales bacterium]|nr:2-oxo-4-hydroxy-4-carboxy-5-ureidoimidazoline decarboxylase [Vicinamibacterales bacterium]